MSAGLEADRLHGESGDEMEEAGTREGRRARSRRQILEAARAVFFRDGFMAANLDEVAEKSAVAKGTLYRYFENKADLYVAVLADDGDKFTDRLRESTSGKSRAVDQLLLLGDFYYRHWIDHPEYFQIFWAVDNQEVIGELPSGVVSEISRLWEQNLRILNGLLERAVEEGDLRDCDCWEVANILWTTANALIQSEAARERRELRRIPLETLYHNAIRYILQGLATAQAGVIGEGGA